MKFVFLGHVAIFTVILLTFSILTLFEFTLTDSRKTAFYHITGQSKTCESASALAKHYFEKNNYIIIRFGLPDSVTLRDVLKADYDVTLMYGTCGNGTDEMDCYNETMLRLLSEKYGIGFYQDARNKAQRLNLERMKTIQKW